MANTKNRRFAFFSAVSAIAALFPLIMSVFPVFGMTHRNSLGNAFQVGLLMLVFLTFATLYSRASSSRTSAFLISIQHRVGAKYARSALMAVLILAFIPTLAVLVSVFVLPELFTPFSLFIRFFPMLLFLMLVSATALFTFFVDEQFWDRYEASPIGIAVVAFIIAFAIIYLPLFLFEVNKLEITFNVPMPDAIGNDLRRYLGWSHALFYDKQYIGPYPPFPLLFFSPLLLLPGPLAYRVIVILAFACYLFAAFVFPRLLSNSKKVKQHMLLWGGLGLFSYGLTFEMQAGQFTLLTFVFALLALYLFHYKKKLRWLAYVLLTVAVQLKLWPGIFLFMLVDDWKDWRANLRRFAGIGVVNFLLLFLFGVDGFIHFVTNLSGEQVGNLWVGNHSAVSFLTGLSNLPAWLQNNIGLVSALTVLGVLIALVLVYVMSIKRKQKGLGPAVFLVSALAALLIPSLSNDYRLPILVAPMALYFASVATPQSWSRRLVLTVVLFFIALAYSFTFFPSGMKPGVFENNFPALYTMLMLVPVSYWLSDHPIA